MNELLEYGFDNFVKGKLSLLISEKEDRYVTKLIIREDNLERVEIRIFMLRIGLKLVSEETVLKNEDGIYTGVKNNYLKFKEKFPDIQSIE